MATTVTHSAAAGQQQGKGAALGAGWDQRRREEFYRTELYNPWTWGQPAQRRGSETAQDAPSWDKEL